MDAMLIDERQQTTEGPCALLGSARGIDHLFVGGASVGAMLS
jgi:hypothetical protein